MPKTVTERSDTLPVIAEVFREHGYDGASLSLISGATGLGKGSLYHFFPDGKEGMAVAVLDEIDAWFEANVFATLRNSEEPTRAITEMFESVESYFKSGRRVCFMGALALSENRTRFAEPVRRYFARWVEALERAFLASGRDETRASALAEELVASIQGAIVLSRALNDDDVFRRTLSRLERRASGADD